MSRLLDKKHNATRHVGNLDAEHFTRACMNRQLPPSIPAFHTENTSTSIDSHLTLNPIIWSEQDATLRKQAEIKEEV